MNKQFKSILLWMILGIILMIPSVSSLVLEIRENQFTGRGLSAIDNNVYILCGIGDCNYYGINATIIRYDTNTGTAQNVVIDRRDFKSWNPTTYITQKTNYTQHFDNLNMYGNIGYYFGKFVTNSGGAGTVVTVNNIELNIYDYINNNWAILPLTFSNLQCNLTHFWIGDGIIDVATTTYSQAMNIITNDLISTYRPNNFLFQTQDRKSNPNNCKQIYQKHSNNTITVFGDGTLLKNINPNVNDKTYTLTHIYNTDGSIYDSTFTTNGIRGSIDEENNLIITTDGNIIYIGSITDGRNGIGGNDIKSLSASCSAQLGQGEIINDFTCRNPQDCVFVGSKDNNGWLLAFNGIDCQLQDLTIYGSYNSSSKLFYAVTYNDYDNKYYIVGNNTFMTYIQQFSNISMTPKCIPTYFFSGGWSLSGSKSYCSSPIYTTDSSGGHIICALNNTIYCGGGCIETNGIASCNSPDLEVCSSTCNIQGSSSCLDTTNIAVCDDWNGLGCLTNEISTTCASGQFCLESGNYLATCINTTQNGTHTNYALSVIPYSSSGNNVSYNNNPATKTVTVNTIFALHEQNFYTTGTTYISRTCDYKETSLYSSGYVNVTELNSNQQTLTSALNTDGIIKLSIRPYFNDTNFNSEGDIRLISSSSIIDSELYYIRNSTAKSLCLLTQFNGSIIYCDYSTNNYDDLISIDLEYSFQFSTSTYTIKVTFNRDVDNIIVINPKTFLGDDIYAINITSTTNPVEILEEIVKSISLYNSFTANNQGIHIEVIEDINCNCGTITCSEYQLIHGYTNYIALCGINQTVTNFVSPCIYTSSGNFVVRTYGNNLGTPDYSIYTDYNVKMEGYGLSQSDISNKNNQKGISTSTKYIIALILLALMIIGGIIIGFVAKNVQAGFVVGIVLATFLLFIFVVIGWIPAWILILELLVAVASIILVSKSPNSNQGSG